MSADVIAIDGPAYVGKTVIARALSELTGHAYISTGHMYRAVARTLLDRKLDPADADGVLKTAGELRIEFLPSGKEWRTMVNGQDWTHALDDPQIVLVSSQIAVLPKLRKILTDMQRAYAQKETIIMEGRDIGSVVFPDARWKFFVTASLEVRSMRMYKMLSALEKARCADFHLLIPRVQEIDDADRNRKVAPLIEAPDAIVYDNSDSPSGMQDALVLQGYIGTGKMGSNL